MPLSSFGFKDAAAAAVVCCVFIFVCLCSDVWCVGQSAIAPGWGVRGQLCGINVYGFLGPNSNHQACPASVSPSEPS